MTKHYVPRFVQEQLDDLLMDNDLRDILLGQGIDGNPPETESIMQTIDDSAFEAVDMALGDMDFDDRFAFYAFALVRDNREAIENELKLWGHNHGASYEGDSQ